MSDLSALEALNRQIEEQRTPIVGAVGPGRASEESTNFLEDTLYYVGKPEEWLVQTMGRVFSDDPKYQLDSSNIYDQVSFFDIAQDITGESTTEANLLLNMPLGLAAAILNPLDPLNVASVAKLTKAGTMGRIAARATATTRGIHQIDIAAQLSQLRKGLGFAEEGGVLALQKGIKNLEPKALAARRSIRRFKKQIPALSKVNEWLEHMQVEKGIPYEDLLEKKTFFERVRHGQQSILGIDPFDNPIIRKLGGISREDRIARSSIRVKGLDAAMTTGAMPFVRAGGKAKELAVDAINKFLPAGTKIPDTETKRVLMAIINKMQKAIKAGQEFNAQEALQQYNFLGRGVDKDQVFNILDELEDVFGGVETRALKDIIDKNPETVFSSIRQIDRNKELLGIRGLDRTRQQIEMVGGEDVVRGVKSEEALSEGADRAFKAFKAGSFHNGETLSFNGQLYVDDQFVVTKLHSARDASRMGLKAKIDEVAELDVPGLVPFSTVQDQTGFYMVTSNVGVHPDAQWTNVHVENLEKVSALLAQKGYFFKDISPSKVMIGRNGELQILDPTILAKVKKNVKGGKIKNAAELSRNTIRNKLFGKIGMTEDYDFSILGQFEADPKVVRGVTKEDIHFQDLTPSAKKLEGDENIRFFNVEDLLRSHNAGYAKILDEETVQKLGIDVLAKEMDEAGVMDPIKIRVDDKGQVYVSQGLENLAAARLLGLEAVPVVREDYIGDVTVKVAGKEAKRLAEDVPSRGPTRGVRDVMDEKPASADSLAPEIQSQLETMVLDDIRVLDEVNQVIGLSDDVFESVDESRSIYDMAEWFSRRGSDDARVQQLGTAWFDQAEAAFLDALGVDGKIENSRAAFLKLEKMLKDVNEPHDLLAAVSEELRLPHGRLEDARSGPLATDFSIMRSELHLMKERFRGLTETLNAGGVFTPGSRASAVGDYTARTGRTIIKTSDEGLEFTNLSKTVEELRDVAEGYVRQQASDISAGAKIDLFGTTPTSVRVSSLLGDSPSGALRPLLPVDTTFFATMKTRNKLRQLGIYINPSREVLEQAGLKTVQGRLSKRPQGIFSISMSGSMVFAPSHSSVEKLMQDLFGQAPRSMQEYGVFTKDGIQLSNVLGMRSVARLIPEELSVIEKRLKGIARRLQAAGFDENVVFGVNTPFGDMWDQLFKKDMKLGEVSSKNFRIEIPENLKGVSLELFDERGAINIADRSKNLPEGTIRKLFKWVEDQQDITALRELEAGLPLNVRGGYYARFLSPEILAKLDELGMRFFSKGQGSSKHFDYFIKNFKGRKLSDLTTREVNKLFKDLQLNPEDLVAFDKLHDSKFMRSLAEVDPKAAKFFLEDPILAVTMRKDLSVQSITNKGAWEDITDRGNGFVVWKGNLADYTKRQGIEGTVLKKWSRIDDLSTKIDELRTDFQNALNEQADGAILQSLEEQIGNLRTQKDKLIDSVLEDETFQIEKGFPLQNEIDQFGIVSIDKAHARRMIDEGVLTEDDILVGNWSAPYVKIQTDTLARKGIKDVEMAVLTKEASDFLDNYFALRTNHNGAWDHFLEKTFDPLNNLFKQTTLFLFPAVIPYTVRNFFSNVMLGWLGNVEMESYSMAIKGAEKIRRFNKGGVALEEAEALLRNEVFTNAFGDTSSLFDIWGAFVQGGGLAGGLHMNEFGMSTDLLKVSVEAGLTPSSNLISGSFLLDSKLLAAGRSMSGALENQFRFAAFVDAWRKGGNFEEAALNVKKLFYNYDELNQFEKQVLKRIMPFYSWSRFNTPRMLETMATQPVTHFRIKSAIADLERGAGGPATEEELPDWLSDRWAITIGRKNGKLLVIGADFLLPMGDVRRLLSSPAQFAIDGTTPFLKYPVEQLFNRSLFSSRISDLFHDNARPIERVPGEPARSGTLRSFGFSRRANPFEGPLGIMNLLMNESMVQNVRSAKWMLDWIDWAYDNTNLRGEAPTLFARMTDAVLARAYTIDPDRFHAEMQRRADGLITKFQWLQRDALKRGDTELADYYRSRITDTATRK